MKIDKKTLEYAIEGSSRMLKPEFRKTWKTETFDRTFNREEIRECNAERDRTEVQIQMSKHG